MFADHQTYLRLYQKDLDHELLTPIGSARDCQQILETWPVNHLKRDINGKLHDDRLGVGQKWLSILSCEDHAALSLDDVYVGKVLYVDCIVSFSCWFCDGQEVSLSREPVKDSVFFQNHGDRHKAKVESGCIENKKITFQEKKTGWISYRPHLAMRVKRYTISVKEWQGKTQWELTLEEI